MSVAHILIDNEAHMKPDYGCLSIADTFEKIGFGYNKYSQDRSQEDLRTRRNFRDYCNHMFPGKWLHTLKKLLFNLSYSFDIFTFNPLKKNVYVFTLLGNGLFLPNLTFYPFNMFICNIKLHITLVRF